MFTLDNLNSRRSNYRAVFDTPKGKEVLKDLMTFAKFFDTSYVPGDPSTTAYNEGMRRIVLRILSIMEKDPAKHQEMITNILRDTNE